MCMYNHALQYNNFLIDPMEGTSRNYSENENRGEIQQPFPPPSQHHRNTMDDFAEQPAFLVDDVLDYQALPDESGTISQYI